MLGNRSTFWVSLLKLASTVDALLVSTNTFCIRANGQALCPGDQPVVLDRVVRVQSGFAPYSVGDKTRKPKWDDTYQFNPNIDKVVFAPDYCFFTPSVEGPKWWGCSQTCHSGGEEPNPWYGHNFGGQQPNYGDPVAGQTNRYLPVTANTCPNPNSMTSQLEGGSGYVASNNLEPLAEANTVGGTTAGDTTALAGLSPGAFNLQANAQNSYYPGTGNQGIVANLAPNNAKTIPNPFSNTDFNDLNLDQTDSSGNTVIGSGAAGSTITTPSTGVQLPGLGNGIGIIGSTDGNTSPGAFNFAKLGDSPFFRKRDAKSARDFRL